MNWQETFTVDSGDSWSTETDLGPISVSYTKETFQGVIHYSRPQFESPESDDTIEESVIIERADSSVSLSFLPLYPDRPVVFKLDETLKVPPGQKGFFCMTFRISFGVTVKQTETLIERVLPQPRKKSYWGPPNNGLSTYREISAAHGEAESVFTDTPTVTATVPIYYHNNREEGDLITHCLVPLQELDLYRNEQDDLIFEVVRLNHQDEFYQEPSPQKRAPKELKQTVSRFLRAPTEARSLFDQVKSLPRLTHLTSIFLNR